MNERPDLGLDPIDPPAGGLEALRARIARHDRRRVVTRWVVPSLAAAVVLVGAILIGRGESWIPVPATPFERDLAARVSAALDPPTDPVSVPYERRGDTAVLRVPTRDDRVVLYMVSTTREPAVDAPGVE